MIEDALNEGYAKGRDEGLAEGVIKGREEGRAEGREEGREEGWYGGTANAAKRMLTSGMQKEQVAAILQLSTTELDTLLAKY